jgi:hypothetical protein
LSQDKITDDGVAVNPEAAVEVAVYNPHTALGRRRSPMSALTSSRTTEVVCRHELRPVITTGADAMDKMFDRMMGLPG